MKTFRFLLTAIAFCAIASLAKAQKPEAKGYLPGKASNDAQDKQLKDLEKSDKATSPTERPTPEPKEKPNPSDKPEAGKSQDRSEPRDKTSSTDRQ